MFILNFFKNSESRDYLKLVSEYFGINYQLILKELENYNEDYYWLSFIEKFNIDLEFKYQEELYITCRHAMTTYDKLDFLSKYGLVNLKTMIEEESPLKRFLISNDILLNIHNKFVEYKGERYPILSDDQKCETCIFNEYRCKSVIYKSPDYKCCDYRECLSRLYRKLYTDKCETEVFIAGDLSDIYEYGDLRTNPEILNNIERIIPYYNYEKNNLREKWKNMPYNKFYLLEFDVNINNFELILNGGLYLYEDIKSFAEKFKYKQYDFEENQISSQFYKNFFIIKGIIDIYGGGIRKEAQLLSDTKIEKNNIRIIVENFIV